MTIDVKRKPSKSPTAMTLELCRSRGCLASVVEYWRPSRWDAVVAEAADDFISGAIHATELRADVMRRKDASPGTRHDLFGCIDLIALTPDDDLLGIQATSYANSAARIKKIRRECAEAAERWLQCGAMLEVWAWAWHSEKVDRRNWRPKITPIVLADF